jgi:hypothetical protein
MIESVTLGADTPRSHDIPWQDAPRYRVSLLHADHKRELALRGIKTTSSPRRTVVLAPCSICGERICPAVTLGALGCTVEAPLVSPDHSAAQRLQAAEERKARRLHRAATWQGDKPTTCQNPGCYGVSLTETFWDGILPDGNGRTHGLYCDLCALTRGTPGSPVKYHRAPRARAWRKVGP